MYLTYSDMMKYDNFFDRLEYLKQNGFVGEETFGCYRYLNQQFYQSLDWRRCRGRIILRDNGNDLAHRDFPIRGSVYVHHINAITKDDILERNPKVFDPENLVCVSFNTHQSITYGRKIDKTFWFPIERTKGDTCLW